MGGGIPSALFKNFRLKGLEIAILAQKKLVFCCQKVTVYGGFMNSMSFKTFHILRTNKQPFQDFHTIFFGSAHITALLSLSHGHQGHHSYDNHQGQDGHHG